MIPAHTVAITLQLPDSPVDYLSPSPYVIRHQLFPPFTLHFAIDTQYSSLAPSLCDCCHRSSPVRAAGEAAIVTPHSVFTLVTPSSFGRRVHFAPDPIAQIERERVAHPALGEWKDCCCSIVEPAAFSIFCPFGSFCSAVFTFLFFLVREFAVSSLFGHQSPGVGSTGGSVLLAGCRCLAYS